MVKHLVFWKLKDTAHGNDKSVNALIIKEKLEALKGVIPNVVEMEVGIDFAHKPASGDVCLYSVFPSREALDAYQAHPAHLAVKGFIHEAITDRMAVDYDC